LLAELHDEEFDEVVSELVQEASAMYEDRISQEFGDSGMQRSAGQESVRDYLEPLVHETEELLETVGQAMSERDVASMSEDQLEEWFEQFEPNRSDLSPAFEGFLKGIMKKVKKIAKGVAKVAQKGLKVATTIATGGMNIILGKLKKLVRPLLNRVLKAAIGKLPPRLRPAAKLLAKRFLGVGETDIAAEGEEGEATGVDTEDIQREFDVQMANSLMAEDMEESETALAEYQADLEEPGESEYDVLQDARARFVGQIPGLQKGEDAKPAMEEFIPAVLAALKIGIKIIGRPRVVNFLSGVVAKLIARFVGKDMALSLSQAIVDTGLRLVSLETTEESETRTAGNAIAATVEETVRQIAALPESAFEDLEVLEAYTLEAFEQAAAANFPPEMIKPDVRESSSNGTWVLMPVNSKRKFYKKYTVVFEKVVSPQAAAKIMTFGGQPLMTVLRDQLNLDSTKDFSARVHIYEAVPGTWLSRISSMERNVPGLGSPAQVAWSQLHPLTPEAAAALLGEPGLGRKVPDRFTQDRNLVEVGQRFYYLEIEGARPVIHPRQQVRRSSRVYVKIDCPGNRIGVALYLSERDAQSISSKLRQNSPWAAIMRGFTSMLQSLRRNFTLRRNVRIVHETVAMEEYAGVLSAAARGAAGILGRGMAGQTASRALASGVLGSITGATRGVMRRVPEALVSKLADKIIEWCLRKVSEYLRERKQEFIKATENPADGVTILIVFANPGLVPLLCKSLRGEMITLTPRYPARNSERPDTSVSGVETRLMR
jgi:hypothetical protein